MINKIIYLFLIARDKVKSRRKFWGDWYDHLNADFSPFDLLEVRFNSRLNEIYNIRYTISEFKDCLVESDRCCEISEVTTCSRKGCIDYRYFAESVMAWLIALSWQYSCTRIIYISAYVRSSEQTVLLTWIIECIIAVYWISLLPFLFVLLSSALFLNRT